MGRLRERQEELQPGRIEYVVIGEWGFNEVRRMVRKTGMYGDMYVRTYWESHKKTPAVQ